MICINHNVENQLWLLTSSLAKKKLNRICGVVIRNARLAVGRHAINSRVESLTKDLKIVYTAWRSARKE